MPTWSSASRAISAWRASASGPRCTAWTRRSWSAPAQFRQVVPVFTNVIFDTSQAHSNMVFPHMFAWLDWSWRSSAPTPRRSSSSARTRTRARPGKESRESVADWARAQPGLRELRTWCLSIRGEYFSSYELIQRSKFVMVYNSTIGLEASLMGAPVLCGGQGALHPASHGLFPANPEDSASRPRPSWLPKQIMVPPADHGATPGASCITSCFTARCRLMTCSRRTASGAGTWSSSRLPPGPLPERSAALRTISAGILGQKPFLLEE